jgi:predicted PurR-regulated permease PerM
MTIAMTIGTHNLGVVPIILAVIITGVAIYLIRQRRGKRQNGHDKYKE